MKNIERIKNILNKYASWIVILSTTAWFLPGFYLIALVDGACTKSALLRIICAYVFLPLPLWLGVFFSNKKLKYFIVIFAWGSFWMVGLVAYYGMNCGIDWSQN
jgi:hypothetical protein